MNSNKKEYIIKKSKESVENFHPCVKQQVYAMIEKDDNEVFGSNKILNTEIEKCPRDLQGYVSGCGYHLCEDICDQKYHAEIDAIKNAEKLGIDIYGGKLTLVGHSYCCENCMKELDKFGIVEIEII